MRHVIILLLLTFQYLFSLGQGATFIENKGQWNKNVFFKTPLPSGSLFLEQKALTYHFRDFSQIRSAHHGKSSSSSRIVKGHVYKVHFDGGNFSDASGIGKQPEYYNYFYGRNTSKWTAHAGAFNEVVYNDVYPGIKLKLYYQIDQLKYDFELEANADPKQIALRYEGTKDLRLSKGNLIIETSVGRIVEQKPYAYQLIDGERIEVKCNYILKDNILSFRIKGDYYKQAPLIIDPVLIFSTYSGSTSDNFGMTATYDSKGNLYAGGIAFDVGYPTTIGAYDTTSNFNGPPVSGITDVVLTKYDSTGSKLLYSTYFGGGNDSKGVETVHSLVVNDQDELFLFGVTSSTDFPVTAGAYDSSFNGGKLVDLSQNGTIFRDSGTDIYVAHFSVDGSTLIGSTLIGGSANDGINYNQLNPKALDSLCFNYGDQFRGEIIIDQKGNCIVASTTMSADFPIVNGFQTTYGGKQDGVVFKFNPTMDQLLWSTFIGGSDKDAAYSCKLDYQDNVVVAGGTASSDIPTQTNSYQKTFGGGDADGMIVKLSDDGTALLASTYFGTDSYDQSFFAETDLFGYTYVFGQTLGSMAIIGGQYSNPNSGQFIGKLNASLDSVIWSTRFGNGSGQINISPSAFLVDYCGNVYISGWGGGTTSNNDGPLTGMPITPDAFQPTTNGTDDFYLGVFSQSEENLKYGSYFGGAKSQEHVDGGTSRFDKNGVIYQSVCAGCGGNSDFPTTDSAWSDINRSKNCNNGVLKFDFQIKPYSGYNVNQIDGCAPLTVNFTNTSGNYSTYIWDFGNGDTSSIELNPTRTYVNPGNYSVSLIVTDTLCGIIDTTIRTITVYDSVLLDIPDTLLTCSNKTIDTFATSYGTASSFHWSSNSSFTDTLNSFPTDSTISFYESSPTYYYIKTSGPGGICDVVDSVFVAFFLQIHEVENLNTVCLNDVIKITATPYTSLFPITYNWSPDSLILQGDGTSEITVKASDDHQITLETTNSIGCSDQDTINISTSALSIIGVNAYADDTIINQGGSTVLHAKPDGYSYTWSPADGLNNPNVQHPSAKPGQTTTYSVSVQDGDCIREDSVTIYVHELECGPPHVFVPTAFSPNDDKENDVLYVRGQHLEKILFRVYDRWGELVFETKDIKSGWNGTFKGKSLDPAVFAFYLEATCVGNQTYFLKGNVTLIR